MVGGNDLASPFQVNAGQGEQDCDAGLANHLPGLPGPLSFGPQSPTSATGGLQWRGAAQQPLAEQNAIGKGQRGGLGAQGVGAGP